MNLPLKISVTERHIENGEKDSCFNCPIALAAREVFPAHSLPEVTLNFLWIKLEDRTERYFTLPEEAKEFVIGFDTGKEVKPFTFTLK